MEIEIGDGAHFCLKTQMTLCFKDPNSGKDARCNLTRFPDVELHDAETNNGGSPRRARHSGESLKPGLKREKTVAMTKMKSLLLGAHKSGALQRLIATGEGDLTRHAKSILIKLARDCPAKLKPPTADFTGAGVLHNLLLANTPEALKLATELCQLVPELLHETHINNGGALCIFEGEGPLHIAAVNRQEKWIISALSIARAHDMDSLTKPSKHSSEVRPSLLGQTCKGKFFSELPMSHLGGTVLAYCAAFNLCDVLRWVAINYGADRSVLFNEMLPEGTKDPNVRRRLHGLGSPTRLDSPCSLALSLSSSVFLSTAHQSLT